MTWESLIAQARIAGLLLVIGSPRQPVAYLYRGTGQHEPAKAWLTIGGHEPDGDEQLRRAVAVIVGAEVAAGIERRTGGEGFKP